MAKYFVNSRIITIFAPVITKNLLTMKKLICMMLLLGCVLTLTAQTYNIEMKAPGMMWYYVEYGDAMYATSIKVKGSINGDDIRLLRQLAGGKYGKELDEHDFG